ncbi:NACHT, LRR and PYD domains-containing protein 1b allele 2-like [Sinocyclocheilus rhinocerous]|uniref:NACHT, LRR and PYD domains-containing protein 1b allele 2-like n=1 Tax=Sinocyclocheilus rhinocerous TaxID=307959 RepID=UPI0007BA0ABF|nr:PREDICTED: NACHT, LRR and PYD domains-containing protein 1b allele 2-like [Sinocyclocheilus rhinocerous]
MVCFCLKKHFTDGDHVMRELKTTTSIYVQFVSTLLEHHDQSQSVLRSLGQLAEEGIMDEEVLFDKKTVFKTGLDAESSLFLHEPDIQDLLRKRALKFMHLSFQEFFMALYYMFLNEEESQRNIRDILAAERVKGRLTNSIPSVLLFLCGLSNEDSSNSLFEKHNWTVPYIIRKEMESTILTLQDEDKLFALQCLYELQDEEFVRRALGDWVSLDLSNISLRSTDCWVLLYCLQCCPHIRYLNLMYCDLTAEKLKILQPALCMCETLRLSVDHLPEFGDLSKTLCEFKSLKELKVQEDEYRGESPRWSLDLSVAQEDYLLSLSSSEKNPSFPTVLNISLTCPQSEISSTDWTLFLQKLSKAGQFAEDSSALDEFVSLLLSSFYFGGLKKLNLKVVSFNESWASGIISLVQTCTSLQQLSIEEYSDNPRSLFSRFIVLVYNEDIRLDIRHRRNTESLSKISLTFPRSALSSSDWKILFQRFHEVSRYQQNSPECNEQADALFTFLHSVCDLKSVELIIFSLNQSWALRILALIQACSSLQEICVRATGLLLEVGLELLYESLTDSHCSVIIEGPTISDSEPSGLNLQPLPVCQSCVHIVDSDQWVQVEPSVCTDEGGSEFRISTPAGRFECSRTRMRWVCAGDVTLQYRAVDGRFLRADLERLQCERIGPVIDVTVISGKLEEAHLPHYACLAESDPSLTEAVKVLSKSDEGISLQSVELTRYHAKMVQPSFSLITLIISWFIKWEEHCDLLLYMRCKEPLFLHIYFFPMNDTCSKEKVEQHEKSSLLISHPRPDRPFRLKTPHLLEVPGASVHPIEGISFRTDIDPNFFKVRQHQDGPIQMNLIREEDRKSVWTATIWKEEFGQLNPMLGERSHEEEERNPPKETQFVDGNYAALIQRVTLVMAIADELKNKGMIHDEKYSEIRAEQTNQGKMRKLFEALNAGGHRVKNAFYYALRNHEPYLFRDLGGDN